ncbi:PorV/PorQ family protein [Adhaeribacter aquaticus]|uniref:putative type IX sorting system protein PorV2 n=1 Tax=Adhaeribacter aquaticus TaxID=299567 RepID=UPI001FE074CC|nr:PorV/PorQ family protein [Adhaeribacter aquaticus]
MFLKISRLWAIIMVVVCIQVNAQVSAPKYSNEFLNIGIGGRALGMGNVQTAIANDVTAGFWNPAGLLNLSQKHNLSIMHSELFAGIVKNDYASYAMPLDTNSAIGISLIRTGVDDIADTRNLINEYGYINYDNITLFSVADYALLLSYARKSRLIKGLRLGGNAKIIYRNVGQFANAYGFGVDLGAQLQRQNWQFGLMARDITTTFNAWVHNSEKFSQTAAITGDSLLVKNSIEITLPRLIFGVARNFTFTNKINALLAADLDFTFDGRRNVLFETSALSVDPHVGVEVSYENLVYVRAGINNMQQIKNFDQTQTWKTQPNFGVGIATNGLRLDLALTRVADTTPTNNYSSNGRLSSVIVSLGYSFN